MSLKNRPIPYNKPFIVGKELYGIAQSVLQNGHIAGNGPFTKKCQQWMEQRLGCPKVLLTHSCTAALEMAAILCGIEPGDEVILPSFTFVSTANAFVLRGGVPVFVDIEPECLNMDPAKVARAVTDRTRAIVPVHYAGASCRMDAIQDVARARKLRVVEDAAHGFLSSYKGRFLGTLGDLGALSFHETKNIVCGEGGALLINAPELAERAEIIWEKGTNRSQFFQGQVDKYTWVDIGSSFMPSDMVAAFLFCQLERAEEINAARRRICQLYMEGLRPLEDQGKVRLPRPAGQDRGLNGHIFFLITKSSEERARLIRFLSERGVHAIFHYVPLHSSPAGRKFGRVSGSMEHTEEMSSRILRLPIFFELSEPDVAFIVEAVCDFYKTS